MPELNYSLAGLNFPTTRIVSGSIEEASPLDDALPITYDGAVERLWTKHGSGTTQDLINLFRKVAEKTEATMTVSREA